MLRNHYKIKHSTLVCWFVWTTALIQAEKLLESWLKLEMKCKRHQWGFLRIFWKMCILNNYQTKRNGRCLSPTLSLTVPPAQSIRTQWCSVVLLHREQTDAQQSTQTNSLRETACGHRGHYLGSIHVFPVAKGFVFYKKPPHTYEKHKLKICCNSTWPNNTMVHT